MNDGNVYNTMRGGQLYFHYIRMTLKVFSKNIVLMLCVFLGVSFVTVYQLIPLESIYYSFEWLLSGINEKYLYNGDTYTYLNLPNDEVRKVTWSSIYHNDFMRGHYLLIESKFYLVLVISLFSTLVFAYVWARFLSKFGKKEGSDKHIRGAVLGNLDKHKKDIKVNEKETGKKSPFTVAGIDMPPLSDTTHIGLIGSPSVGKSTVMKEIMSQLVEKRNSKDKQKAFIYDPSGEFTRKFYREGIDIILSPEDARSSNWTVWGEGANQASYRTLSKALIPDVPKSDPFFNQAARVVFESICGQVYDDAMNNNQDPTMDDLLQKLMRLTDAELSEYLADTDAGRVFNSESEKTASSIRGTLTTYVQPLTHLKSNPNVSNFNFSEWMHDEQDSWVFIPIETKAKELFAPLITMWIEQFTKATLSMPTDFDLDDRYFLFCDELAGLNKIPTLSTFLGEGRKYGGCGILGFQSKFQLDEIYGNAGSKTLIDIILTYLIYRVNGTDGAKWASDMLLDNEVSQANENLSFGANDKRDSVSIGRTRKQNKLVTSSEIVGLKDLEGFVRFGKGYDILKFKSKYKPLEDIAEPMVKFADMTLPESIIDFEIDEFDIDSINDEIKESPKPKKRTQNSEFDDIVMPTVSSEFVDNKMDTDNSVNTPADKNDPPVFTREL